jgi:hypothetical protein
MKKERLATAPMTNACESATEYKPTVRHVDASHGCTHRK